MKFTQLEEAIISVAEMKTVSIDFALDGVR
jgi:hypothetical protein